MKNYLCSIYLFCMTSCLSSSVPKELSLNETLISTHYKLIEHGYLIFLVPLERYQMKEIVYSYSINMKNRSVLCSNGQEKIFNIQDKRNYLKDHDFRTAKEFKQTNRREKYYTCFSEDFLDMTNDEKIDLLNKLCDCEW